jgi:hypothetical protein
VDGPQRIDAGPEILARLLGPADREAADPVPVRVFRRSSRTRAGNVRHRPTDRQDARADDHGGVVLTP